MLPFQHSPMLGQRASSHTVLRLSFRRSFLIWVNLSPPGRVRFSQSGFRAFSCVRHVPSVPTCRRRLDGRQNVLLGPLYTCDPVRLEVQAGRIRLWTLPYLACHTQLPPLTKCHFQLKASGTLGVSWCMGDPGSHLPVWRVDRVRVLSVSLATNEVIQAWPCRVVKQFCITDNLSRE